MSLKSKGLKVPNEGGEYNDMQSLLCHTARPRCAGMDCSECAFASYNWPSLDMSEQLTAITTLFGQIPKERKEDGES